MTFLTPSLVLHLLWLLPLLLALAWWGAQRRRQRLVLLVADPALAARLAGSASPGRRAWRVALLLAAVALLVTAAARPRWGTRLTERPTRARDVLVIIDTSRSMLARDLAPSRLQHAKWVVRQLLERFPGDRFGLIAFAGDAELLCPLTPNRASFRLYLDGLDTTAIAIGGTNIPAALAVADRTLKAAEDRHQAIILITDGDNLDGDPLAAVKPLATRQVPVHVVGLGDAALGSYLQLADNSFITDAEGKRVNSRLNEPLLRQLSAATGGLYLHSTAEQDGVEVLASVLQVLLPAGSEARSASEPIERYQIPLALALLCLLVRQLIGERRSAASLARAAAADAQVTATGAALGWVVLAVVLAGAPGTAMAQLGSPPPPVPRDPAVQAATPVPGGAPSSVALTGTPAPTAAPVPERDPLTRDYATYNTARADQSAGRLAEAQRGYESVVGSAAATPELRAAALQNLGVLRHQSGLDHLRQQQVDPALADLTAAQSYYREGLRQAPQATGLADNLELSLRHQQQAEELRRQQQELKKQQQQAQDQTKQALKQQQQAGAAQNERDRQAEQQKAKEQTQAAQAATQKLAETAKQQGQEQQAQDAQQAAEQLAKAQEHQQQAAKAASPQQGQQAGKQAEEDLKNALAKLGEKPPENGDQNQQQQASKDPNKDPGKSPPKASDSQSGQPPPNGQPTPPPPSDPGTGATAAAKPVGTPPPDEAARAMAQMQRDEKDFAHELREAQRARSREQVPAKDW